MVNHSIKLADSTNLELSQKIEKLEAMAEQVSTFQAYRIIQARIHELKEQVKQTESNNQETCHFFQAIGVIKGKLLKKEELIKETGETKTFFSIAIANSNKVYSLRYPRSRKQIFRYLCLQTKRNPDAEVYCLVYPKLVLIPRQKPELCFEILSWQDTPIQGYKENQFILRGIWQFIPQFRYPVVSINRNKIEKERRKELLASGDNFKGTHIPLMWKNPDVLPYRHNPKAKKDDTQMDRYFVQVIARFLPKMNSFGFQELLESPTLNIPRYMISAQKMEQKMRKKNSKKTPKK